MMCEEEVNMEDHPSFILLDSESDDVEEESDKRRQDGTG